MKLTSEEIEYMQNLIKQYDKIICYTDGAASPNPGSGGAAVVFTGVGAKGFNSDLNLPISF